MEEFQESYSTQALVSYIEKAAGPRAAAVCQDGGLDGQSFLLLSPSKLTWSLIIDSEVYYAAVLSLTGDVRENWPMLGDRLKISAILAKLSGRHRQQERRQPPAQPVVQMRTV